jgi:trimeric autotransporter adhesin
MAWGVPRIGAVATVASGNITLAEPAGITSGDLMIACIGYRSNAAFTVPGDWNLIATQQSSGDTDATNGIASALMMWCVRGGSAPTLTFNRTAGDAAQGRIIAYTGGHASAPYDTGSAATNGANSTIVSVTGINTAEAGELLVAMVSAGDTLTTSGFAAAVNPGFSSGATDTTTAPTAGQWIERADSSTGTGSDHGLAIADAVRSAAGGTGNIQATVSASARHAMVVGAFKLADAGISFAGTSAGTSTATADVQITKNLSSSSAGASTAAAVLGVTKKLAASSAGTSTASADLSLATPVNLAGDVAGSSTTSAAATVGKRFAGSSAGTSVASSILSVAKHLAGASAGGSTAAGALAIGHRLATTSAGGSTAAGALSLTKNLAAASAGTSTASADLSNTAVGSTSFAGTSNGGATASASLTIARSLSGASSGTAIASAGLSITRNLSGTSDGLATVTGSLQLAMFLQASVSGATTVTAELRNTAPPIFEHPYSFVVEKAESGFYIEPAESGFAIGVAETSFEAE